MSKLQPMSDYLKAVRLYREGNEEEAAKALARAAGMNEPNGIIKSSLKSLCSEEDPNVAIVTLVNHRMETES